MKYLIYCTKAKPYLYKCIHDHDEIYWLDNKYDEVLAEIALNGKIFAECEMEVEEINVIHHYETYFNSVFCYDEAGTKTLDQFNLLQKSCLTRFELSDYLGTKSGYALHIKNLKVFDEPLELLDVAKGEIIPEIDARLCLTKAPQNMMKVWYKGHPCVLISIQPEWACKILNGEKTVEVRKQVLNCMKGERYE